MSFLSIPSQEALFTTVRTEGAERRSPLHEDDTEEDDTENSRLIPRCSPVPRKRGASIHDETAEYLRIHRALSAGKQVSFADTTGGDLVDIREFVAFDSEDEEDAARWEEEQLKYRKQQREPTYRVQLEFVPRMGGELLQAVTSGRVEVEQMSPVENEPLSLSGVIRVLNVSFHKAVYIRSTLDNWNSYFEQPAEYVHGSNDGHTDQFSFKLAFAPPYVTHGSRIEFVVRYETSEGDFWANNSSMNYVLTLLVSYEDDATETDALERQLKGILRPPKVYRTDRDDSADEQTKSEEDEETSSSGRDGRPAVRPIIGLPEIDVEIDAPHPGSPQLLSADGSRTSSPGTPEAFSLRQSVRPRTSQPPSSLHRTSEEPVGRESSATPSCLRPELGADVQEAPPHPCPITETTEAIELDDKSASCPGFHLPVTLGGQQEAPQSRSDPKTSEDSSWSPDLSFIGGGTEVGRDAALQSEPVCEEKNATLPISPDTLSEDQTNSPSEAKSAGAAGSLMSSVVPLSGAVSLAVVTQEPAALVFVGLLWVVFASWLLLRRAGLRLSASS